MFNNKGAATTFAILAMSGLLGFGGYKSCSQTSEIREAAKFSVNQCVLNSRKEQWESDIEAIYRIDAVGIKKYRVTYYNELYNRTYTTDYTFWMIDDYYNLTICPDELKGF